MAGALRAKDGEEKVTISRPFRPQLPLPQGRERKTGPAGGDNSPAGQLIFPRNTPPRSGHGDGVKPLREVRGFRVRKGHRAGAENIAAQQRPGGRDGGQR